ncbi:hypothetical protein MKX41_30790 [Paenibacillus sp. FSL R5-0475]|uniref:hypothetical protein n=1 Tax=Paenibacillus sp. FSL R5-0475 TaxID=2921643 RepID=UPI0030F64B38
MSKIIVKYVTKRAYCKCCSQKLPQIETSKEKQFTIRKEDVTDWAEQESWQSASDSPGELYEMVREFTNEIISFHAADMTDRIVIEKTELDRVNEFITREVLYQAVRSSSQTE